MNITEIQSKLEEINLASAELKDSPFKGGLRVNLEAAINNAAAQEVWESRNPPKQEPAPSEI